MFVADPSVLCDVHDNSPSSSVITDHVLRQSPGQWPTRAVTAGVTMIMHVHYRQFTPPDTTQLDGRIESCRAV